MGIYRIVDGLLCLRKECICLNLGVHILRFLNSHCSSIAYRDKLRLLLAGLLIELAGAELVSLQDYIPERLVFNLTLRQISLSVTGVNVPEAACEVFLVPMGLPEFHKGRSHLAGGLAFLCLVYLNGFSLCSIVLLL